MSYSVWNATLTYNDGSPQAINLHAYGGDAEQLIVDVSRTQTLHNELRPVQDKATVSLLFRTSLANTLIQIDQDVRVVLTITKDGSAWFKGDLRPLDSIATTNTPDSRIDLEAVDNSERLKRRLTADYTAVSKTVSTIVTELLTAAGYAGAEYSVPTISDTIGYVLEQAHETTYWDVISDILYSYGRTFYFDESGVFQVYQWGAAGTPSPTGTLADDGMVGELQAERVIDDVTGVEVVWYESKQINDYVLHSATFPGTLAGTFSTPVNTTDQPTATLFEYNLSDREAFGEGTRIVDVFDEKIKVTYKERRIVCTGYIPFTSICLSSDNKNTPRGPFEYTAPGGIVSTLSFGDASATVQFTNNVTSVALWIQDIAFTISGTVRYAQPQPPVVLGTRERSDEIEGRYLYSRAAANALANAIRARQTSAKYRYKARSEALFTVGQYVTLSSGVSGLNISQTCRVVSRREVGAAEARGKHTVYSYELEGVGTVGTTATAVTGGTVAVTPTPPAPGAPSPSTPVISGDGLGTNDDPGESGLYMTNRFLGMYEQDKQWIAVIENDGGVGKLRVGFGDKYINWDGTDLTIQGDVRSGNFVAGTSGWEILNNGDAEFNDVTVRGTIEATTGDIGGWEILANEIRSANDLTRIRADRNRLQIDDALSTVKVALGYLGDVPGFTSDDFGLYVADGNSVSFSSGASFEEGSYLINSDAAFVAQSGGAEAVRLGSLGGGDIGLDIGGMSFADTLGGGAATGTFGDTLGGGTASSAFTTTLGGGGARYGTAFGLLYSLADDRLFLTGTLVGVDGEFSGSLKAATGTFTGALEAATGTFAGLVSGGSIDIGGGDFTVDSAGNVVANNIDIAGGAISGSIELSGAIEFGSGSQSTRLTENSLRISAPASVNPFSFVAISREGANPNLSAEIKAGRLDSITLAETTTFAVRPSEGSVYAAIIPTGSVASGYLYVDPNGFVKRQP